MQVNLVDADTVMQGTKTPEEISQKGLALESRRDFAVNAEKFVTAILLVRRAVKNRLL
jgi:hypothetical protein